MISQKHVIGHKQVVQCLRMPRNPLTLVLLKTQIKNHPTYEETNFTYFKNFTAHSMRSHNESTSKEKVKKGQLI